MGCPKWKQGLKPRVPIPGGPILTHTQPMRTHEPTSASEGQPWLMPLRDKFARELLQPMANTAQLDRICRTEMHIVAKGESCKAWILSARLLRLYSGAACSDASRASGSLNKHLPVPKHHLLFGACHPAPVRSPPHPPHPHLFLSSFAFWMSAWSSDLGDFTRRRCETPRAKTLGPRTSRAP